MPSSDLLARYLHAVGFWLPRTNKHDILAEISEDLHSQIDDRAASLNRPLNDAEIAEILKQRGRPAIVAGSFLPQRQLIGPVMFPIYIFVLKIVGLCYLVPWLSIWLGFVIFNPSFLIRHSGGIFGPLGTFWTILWTIFGSITFLFAVLDHSSNRAKFLHDWDPSNLPKINTKKSQNKTWNAIAGIVFGFVGLGWLLAIRSHLFLVLGPAAIFIKFAPVWRVVYPWIIVLAVAGITENILRLVRSLPAWGVPVFKLSTLYINAWIIAKLLHTHSYFTVAAQSAAAWVPLVNTLAYYCIIANAIGLIIAFVVNGWKLTQAVERERKPTVARTTWSEGRNHP